MKFIQALMAALLLVFSGSIYSDSVLILNLEDGDVVDSNKFMIVGQGSGYDEGSELLINIEVCSVAALSCKDVYLSCDGMSSFGDVTILNPVGKQICPVKNRKIPIIARSSENAVSDQLWIRVKIWNPMVEEWQTDEVMVFTE